MHAAMSKGAREILFLPFLLMLQPSNSSSSAGKQASRLKRPQNWLGVQKREKKLLLGRKERGEGEMATKLVSKENTLCRKC